MTSERPGARVPARCELRAADNREEEELSKFPRPGKTLSITAEIKNFTPFSEFGWSGIPGYYYGLTAPQRELETRHGGPFGEVVRTHLSALPVLLRSGGTQRYVPGIFEQGSGWLNMLEGQLFRVFVRHLHKSPRGGKKNHWLLKKPQRNLILGRKSSSAPGCSGHGCRNLSNVPVTHRCGTVTNQAESRLREN